MASHIAHTHTHLHNSSEVNNNDIKYYVCWLFSSSSLLKRGFSYGEYTPKIGPLLGQASLSPRLIFYEKI